MASKRSLRTCGTIVIITIAIVFLTIVYSPCASETPKIAPHISGTTTASSTPWLELQQRVPYPFTIQLPKPIRTILDGTYTKFELKETPPVHCRRCPDYALEGGIWKLSLDKGVFRIFHEVTGWRSLGSFFVSKDGYSDTESGQFALANDPTCQEVIGVYTWKLEEGKLIFKVIDDHCAIRLRAMNLTNLPWFSCQPPSIEAAITDHWPKPQGCD